MLQIHLFAISQCRARLNDITLLFEHLELAATVLTLANRRKVVPQNQTFDHLVKKWTCITMIYTPIFSHAQTGV